MSLSSLLLTLRRRLRRLLGKGWSRIDFQSRYADASTDAWGYADCSRHAFRFRKIIEAIPATRFSTILEVGCAEGELTKRLAERAEHVVACDLSPEAITRARDNCSGLGNVKFSVTDIRTEHLDSEFDLCVLSDVLYYMTPIEIRSLLVGLFSLITPDGLLLFANEWQSSYRDLTAPEEILRLFAVDGRWRLCSQQTFMTDSSSTLTIAVFQRVSGAELSDV